MDSPDRQRRRRHRTATERTTLRRLSDHRFWVHQDDDIIREWPSTCCCDDKGPHFWDTRRPLSCNCRKRKHGQPKVWGDGMCCCDDRRRVIRWRQQERQLRWTVWHEVEPDWNSDRLALLASPVVLPRS
ncbi:MAG: hypothetical protein A2Y38_02665 [Spirochaetes bacterium GWB1_59_5]|nr:MAG: hypothetical protein A2Y38_02665 [Spirochaetes bacterium GWB1_59_5]